MKRAVAVFLFLASLVALTQAVDHQVSVGTAKGNLFDPALVAAAAGDNIVFTWNGPAAHNVIESDGPKSCVKSVKPTALASGDPVKAPKTWTVPVPSQAKSWFYCAPHCANGMYMTVTVDGAPPAGGMPAANGTTPDAGATPSASPAAKSVATRNYNSFAAAVVFSSMCMAASYVL